MRRVLRRRGLGAPPGPDPTGCASPCPLLAGGYLRVWNCPAKPPVCCLVELTASAARASCERTASRIAAPVPAWKRSPRRAMLRVFQRRSRRYVFR